MKANSDEWKVSVIMSKRTVFKMKHTIKKAFVLLVILSIALNLSGCSIMLSAVLNSLVSDPPQPKIKYGEFPFEFVCEINGEEFSVKDTLVIEHIGVSGDAEQGKENNWKSYLLNSSAELYEGRNEVFIKEYVHEDGRIYAINLFLGTCEYYMGLEEQSDTAYYMNHIQPGRLMLRGDGCYAVDDWNVQRNCNLDIKIIKSDMASRLYGNAEE